MSISVYDASVPVFVQVLEALIGLVDKAEAHAQAKKIEPSVLLGARLFPDMFPLIRQLQLSTDFAKGACARLAGVDVPSYQDNEASFADIRQRLKRTIEFVQSLPKDSFAGGGARDVTVRVAGQPTTFKGQPYLLHFALPNFYFHATTAYAILRHCGIELGKRDFIGKVPGL